MPVARALMMPSNGLGISGGAPIDRYCCWADSNLQKSDDLAGAKRRPLHAHVGRQLRGGFVVRLCKRIIILPLRAIHRTQVLADTIQFFAPGLRRTAIKLDTIIVLARDNVEMNMQIRWMRHRAFMHEEGTAIIGHRRTEGPL